MNTVKKFNFKMYWTRAEVGGTRRRYAFELRFTMLYNRFTLEFGAVVISSKKDFVLGIDAIGFDVDIAPP